MENKYQNAKIYKIVDVDYNKCYIGSTTESLSQRFARHRMHYANKVNGKQHTNMRSLCLFDEFGVDNCKIELIENYPCENRELLLKREGYHIKSTDCVNRCVAGRTPKEYKEDNKDEIREWTKQYNLENKHIFAERRREYRQQYYLENKEVIKERNSQYYKTEKAKEQRRQYLLNNKETLYAKLAEKVECVVCGSVYRRGGKADHERTIKHQKALETKEVSP